MNETPVATGLLVCELMITDAHTGYASFVNRYSTLLVDEFPSTPQKMTVFAALIDGFGEVRSEPSSSRSTATIRSTISPPK
jgi:hypothetical protein